MKRGDSLAGQFNKCHCIVSLISTHNAVCNILFTQTQTSLEDHYFFVVRGLVYLSDTESCVSGSLTPGRATRTSRKVEVRRKVIHWPSRLRVGYWANIPVPQKVFSHRNSKRRNQNNRNGDVMGFHRKLAQNRQVWRTFVTALYAFMSCKPNPSYFQFRCLRARVFFACLFNLVCLMKTRKAAETKPDRNKKYTKQIYYRQLERNFKF